jgi:hypothetical protein
VAILIYAEIDSGIASCTIGAEAPDPLQVHAGGAVLHTAIAAPDAEYVFGGGRGGCGEWIERLVLHSAGITSVTLP